MTKHAVAPASGGAVIRQPGLFALLRARVARASLAAQFLAVGGVVSILAMILIGAVVTSVIERSVTRNAATTTALYVDSVIAPLLPDMRSGVRLDSAVRRALDETLGEGALGDRLVDMRLWALDGTILYARNPSVVGKRFALSPGLRQAASGQIVARYDNFDNLSGEDAPPGPLLEIYNPILQPWSGEVVAVIEFYEKAHELEATLSGARLRSWAAVAVATLLFFASLSLVVFRGSRTIERQAEDLSARIAELTTMQRKVRRATEQATALNESYLRRLGADLHDGPAQYVALAAMRLDSDLVSGPDSLERDRELAAIRSGLDEALEEIRAICRGLVLPHIESSDIATVVERSIAEYEKRSGMSVERSIDPPRAPVGLSQRICAYRFVQEALSNGHRHCRGAPQSVVLTDAGHEFRVTVTDRGPGFDPARVPPDRIGIAGLRERIESIGGTFELHTSPGGTTLSMALRFEGNVPA